MFHLKAIDEVEEVTVVSVADSDVYLMEHVKKKSLAIKGYVDYLDLLRDPEVEAVAINTPPNLHEEMVIQSLKAGKHVLCEKPLARSAEGCLRIKGVNESAGLVVMPCHNYVFTPCLERAKELIRSGAFGELEKISVRFENNLRGYRSRTDFRLKGPYGIVEDVLPHILSVILGLTGRIEKIVEVRSRMEKYNVVDNMNLLFRTEKDSDLDCLLSWTKLIPSFKIKAIGEFGWIEMDLIRSPFTVSLESKGKRKKIGKQRGLSLYLDLLRMKHPSFQSQYRHLWRLVNGLEEQIINIDDEIYIVQTMEDVIKSSAETDRSIHRGG